MRSYTGVLILGVLPGTAASHIAAAQTEAPGTSYYLDSARGNDSSPGTSPKAAWKSLSKVNATTFKPGDRILLKSGSAWNGQIGPDEREILRETRGVSAETQKNRQAGPFLFQEGLRCPDTWFSLLRLPACAPSPA